MSDASTYLRGAAACVCQCQDREILLEGRAGTGKSIGILNKRYRDAVEFAGSRHLFVRQTRESCTQSVLVTWEEKVLGPTHPLVVNGPSRENREEYVFPNGSVVVVGGLDKPAKLFSTEWDTLYFNEAHEGTLEAWELFGRAMRNNRMPYQQRVADVNPNAPGHWLNKRAYPCPDELRRVVTPADYRRLQRYHREQPGARMRRFVSVHQDNPAYFDFETWQWTTLGLLFLSELRSMSGHTRERMLEGRWVAAEGTVYPEFSEAAHVHHPPFRPPEDWPIYVGWDAGYDHPTAILWFAVAPNETVYVIDEIYQGGRSVADHCKNVHARNAGRTVRRYYADPQHCFSQTAQAPKSIASQAKECGITLTPWPRTGGNEESMVERVRERLRQGRLKVFSTCVNTINEFQSWSYKRSAKGELMPGEDKFEDRNNDAMDVVKGVIATNPLHNVSRITVVGEKPPRE